MVRFSKPVPTAAPEATDIADSLRAALDAGLDEDASLIRVLEKRLSAFGDDTTVTVRVGDLRVVIANALAERGDLCQRLATARTAALAQPRGRVSVRQSLALFILAHARRVWDRRLR